jgi:NodT family efflux transporter outer membrane factor (OMF) lipoprotein
MSSKTAKSFSLLAALGLGACSVGPDFVPPTPSLPVVSFLGKPKPALLPDPSILPAPPPDPRWWAKFRDPVLMRLEQQAVAANLDLQTATIKIAESRFQRGVAASAALPTLNGNATYTRELLSQNGIVSLAKSFSSSSQPFTVPPISIYQPTFDAAWELDIWGHVRRQIEAADAQIQLTEEQRRDVLVTLLAEVARDYIELRGVQNQLSIAMDNLKSATEIMELTRTRTEKGLVTGLDVENASAEVESIKAQIPQLRTQETLQINALSLLLNEPPGALQSELARAKPIPPAPAHVPLGIPSELARRRPDIRQAEAQLHAATADIGVAVAEFYPSVKLNGSVGFNALDLKNLWKGSSLQYTFGPSISLPIFEGGRLKSTLELREAQQQEAAIGYQKAVLQAWHDVVNALVSFHNEQERRARLKAQVDHLVQVLSLSRSRYSDGVTEFLTVLDAERNLFAAQQQYSTSSTSISTDLVQLYKALGGGWETTLPDEPYPTLTSNLGLEQAPLIGSPR